jgi:hypothetical protein
LPSFPPPQSFVSQDGFFFNSSKMVASLVKLAGPHVQEVLDLWWGAEELYVRELARTLKPHSNVIGFDLGSEIDNCWHASAQDSDPWMARMFALVKEVLPAHVHVNGVLNSWLMDEQILPDGRRFQIAFSPQALAKAQFPVMHSYPYWNGATKYGGAMDPTSVKLLAGTAALIRAYAGTQQKPVWAGEFNTCINELPEKGQAEWLEKAVLSAIDEGVSWFSYWDTHDLNPRFAFEPPLEYNLGLLTNDGHVKEQGRVFKQLADTYRGKPVSFPKTSLPAPPTERTQDATWRWLLNWMDWKPKAT